MLTGLNSSALPTAPAETASTGVPAECSPAPVKDEPAKAEGKPLPARSTYAPSQNEKAMSHFAWAFACLLLVEIVAFGINVKSVGVYQDEWISFGSLHFVNQTIPDLIAAFNADPRKIVRPLQFLNIPVLFYFVKENPLWYHILSYTAEFCSSWFLYLAVSRLAASRAVALGAALLFLLYPSHDSTHYSIVLWNSAMDTMFFTMSLWLFIKGLQDVRNSLVLWSGVAYCASIYTREEFLPMVVLFPLISILLTKESLLKNREKIAKYCMRICAYSLPALLAVASLVVYRSWLLPKLNLGWKYHQVYSLSNFTGVVEAGLRSNLSPDTLAFCIANIERALSEGVDTALWALLAVTVSIIFVGIFRVGVQQPAPTTGKTIQLIIVGLVTLLVSYTLFGLSPEHMPTLDTWLNRVNLGGSLGACLIIAAVLGVNAFKESRRLTAAVFAASVSLLAGLFILTNWQLAEPWKVSWKAQKQLMTFLKANASQIKSGDTIIIGDIGRYTSKATPVVDGDWDWENIIRTTLDDPTLKGTVITDRLFVEGDKLVDPPCGEYEFSKMLLFSPKRGAFLTRVNSRDQFMQEAQKLGWKIAIGQSETASKVNPRGE